MLRAAGPENIVKTHVMLDRWANGSVGGSLLMPVAYRAIKEFVRLGERVIICHQLHRDDRHVKNKFETKLDFAFHGAGSPTSSELYRSSLIYEYAL